MRRRQGKIFSYQELQQRLEAIQDPRDKAFLCATYATLARVGEVCHGKLKSVPPLGKSGITIDNEKQLIRFTITTEKVQIVRIVPVSMAPRDTSKPPPWGEKWLIDPIIEHIKTCPTEELFDYSSEWGERIFKEHFPESGRNIHSLRKMRATHLRNKEAIGIPVDIQHVAYLGGWININTLHRVYAHLNTADYEKEII